VNAFLVWGGGGHGKVVADLIRATGGTIIGFVDADPDKLGLVVEPGGSRVVLTEAEFLAGIAAGDPLPERASAVAIAIGENRRRFDGFCRLRDRVQMPPVVHDSAIVSTSSRIGPATVLMPNVVVNAETRIGAAVIVNTGAIVEHDCVIGDGAHLAPRSAIAGAVTIGERVLLGLGAVVIPGRSIGDDAVVGAGGVVVRDIEPAVTVAGSPARRLHR
jgi:sugar O-acyltransferase (sialic acid O-acetyltransferase NeuD family)